MYIGRIIGQVVSSKKDEHLHGHKLVLVRPELVSSENPKTFESGKNTIVAMDNLGAGEGEWVLFTQGSSARKADGMKNVPVDAVVIGIVDSVHVEGHKTYPTPTQP